MLDLVLSILCSSLIFVIFKLFSKYKIETLYAIITNYAIACTLGFSLYDGKLELSMLPEQTWFWGAFALGLLFILVFNLMAATSQKLGVSVASVATKMSLVVPVLIGVLIYKEELGSYKILGILLALAAVYFASVKENTQTVKHTSLLLPFLTFIGSGAVDSALAYFQKEHLASSELHIFSAAVFGFAGVIGISLILLKSFKKPIQFNIRNVIGGLCLGLTNYFSIYFLMRALQNDSLNSSSIFTINNVAIVMFSTLLGILLFKEKISLKNWGGIVLAVASILLVALF